MNTNSLEQDQTRTGPFHGASQFTIKQANMVEKVETLVIAGPKLETVFDLLKSEISTGAMHDSGDRHDPPKCHPGTREKVLGEIMSWINSKNPESRAMWLRGPAGAGKSAIAQTTAEQCEGKLLGSFFFSRFDSERNRAQRLIPTIAYQLAMYVPEARPHLLDILRDDGPALLKLSLERQIQRLLVDPIMKVFAELPAMSPKCVVIDGLDECQDSSRQAEIIRCVLKAASTLATLGCPVSFLVVSRPELEIRQAFNEAKRSNKFIVLDLNKAYDPEKDIDWFLRDKFEGIKSTHPVGHRLGSNWPSNEQIEHIVQKSSGQFIYAATVIRYVQNIRSNPAKSLDEITGIPRASGINNRFAELDRLYTYILQSALEVAHSDQIYPKLISIFEALLYLRYTKHPDLLDEFLGLEGDVEILLGDLYSIVFVPEDRERGEIKFHHASFGDFLKDERRSGNFFINEALAHFRLSNCCVKILKKFVDNYSPDNPYPKAFYPSIREYFHHVNKWLQLASSLDITRSSEMPNDGIDIICHAAVKSKYAAIGIHANTLGGRILGSFSQMIISGTIGDTSNGEYDWIFEEMGTHTKVLSIGAYLERGAGTWNHIVLEDPNPASLRFLHSHIAAIFQTSGVANMKCVEVCISINDVPGLLQMWPEPSQCKLHDNDDTGISDASKSSQSDSDADHVYSLVRKNVLTAQSQKHSRQRALSEGDHNHEPLESLQILRVELQAWLEYLSSSTVSKVARTSSRQSDPKSTVNAITSRLIRQEIRRSRLTKDYPGARFIREWGYIGANVLVKDNLLFLDFNHPHKRRKDLKVRFDLEFPTLPCNIDVKKISLVTTFTNVNDYQPSHGLELKDTTKPSLMLSIELHSGESDHATADIDTFLKLCQHYAINLSMLKSSIFVGGKAPELRNLIEYNFKTLTHLELLCAGCQQEHTNMLFVAALKCPRLEILTFGTCYAGTTERQVALIATLRRQLEHALDSLVIAIVEVTSSTAGSTWKTKCKWNHNDLKIYVRDGPEVDNRAMIEFKHLLSLVEFPCQWLAEETMTTSALESFTEPDSSMSTSSESSPAECLLVCSPLRSYMKKIGFNVGRVIRRLLCK